MWLFSGHLTTMCDVYSFGVVLLELLTGRRCLDKSRFNKKQNLVDWAKPILKDPHKLEHLIDPRLEGQYSTEGARKAASLAYQCLSQNPKSRPTMRSVVKTLEPLMDLKDVPIGPFVYIVPTEGNHENGFHKKGEEVKEESKVETKAKKQEDLVEMKAKSHRRRGKGHRHKHKIKSLRSNAVYSDTVLYKTLGSSSYSLS